MQNVTDTLFSLEEATTCLRVVTKCFLIFIVDEVKNFVTNNLLQVGDQVMYWGLHN